MGHYRVKSKEELVGAVGIEPTTFGLKVCVSASLLPMNQQLTIGVIRVIRVKLGYSDGF